MPQSLSTSNRLKNRILLKRPNCAHDDHSRTRKMPDKFELKYELNCDCLVQQSISHKKGGSTMKNQENEALRRCIYAGLSSLCRTAKSRARQRRKDCTLQINHHVEPEPGAVVGAITISTRNNVGARVTTDTASHRQLHRHTVVVVIRNSRTPAFEVVGVGA